MTVSDRPMLKVLRERLRALQTEPGPVTLERALLMGYLAQRIVAYMPSARTRIK
jgi:hypothetical protein